MHWKSRSEFSLMSSTRTHNTGVQSEGFGHRLTLCHRSTVCFSIHQGIVTTQHCVCKISGICCYHRGPHLYNTVFVTSTAGIDEMGGPNKNHCMTNEWVQGQWDEAKSSFAVFPTTFLVTQGRGYCNFNYPRLCSTWTTAWSSYYKKRCKCVSTQNNKNTGVIILKTPPHCYLTPWSKIQISSDWFPVRSPLV